MNGDVTNPVVSNPTDVIEFLKNQLNKSAIDSKKYKMATLGLKGIVAFFVIGIAMAFIRPLLFTQVTSLIQITLGAWAAVISVFIGMQGAVDYRTTAGITSTATVTTTMGSPTPTSQPLPAPTPSPIPTSSPIPLS